MIRICKYVLYRLVNYYYCDYFLVRNHCAQVHQINLNSNTSGLTYSYFRVGLLIFMKLPFVNCCLPFTAAIPKTQNFLLQINRSSFAWKCNCRFQRARLQPKESLWHRTNFQPVEIRTFSVHAEPT